MKKYVVTWTFARHIHRHREYKMITKVILAIDEGHVAYFMNNHPDVQALYDKGFKSKLKSITVIDGPDFKTSLPRVSECESYYNKIKITN